MAERPVLRQFSQRGSYLASEFRHPVHRGLCPKQPVVMVAGNFARVRRLGAPQESGALANRSGCRLDARNRDRLLVDDVEDSDFGPGTAPRPLGGLLQEVLMS